MNNEAGSVIKAVHDQYAAVARSGLSNDSSAVRSVASAFGYSEAELASLPAEANMGLSCGNPLALASLKPGEVVVDLGCGGGLDVLLASRHVGPSGKAIGIDMTADMLQRARAGAAKAGVSNVEFHQAQIDALPLSDNSVDCIISNCVINLVPDKAKVFREIFRVLKPRGRVAISDIALKQPLPEDIKSSVEAYVGCIAGAIMIDDYQRLLREAGFDAVVVLDTGADLNAYATSGLSSVGCCADSPQSVQAAALPVAGCCDTSTAGPPPIHEQLATLLATFDANAYAASVRVQAIKSTTAANDIPSR
jgi:arsenite methyltransferase